MVSNCVFCKIINGDIKSDVVYETEDVLAIRDVAPQAPHHYLIIPKLHIPTSQDVRDPSIWANLMEVLT
ncbi:MAG: HIT domain-containing protein, partial [Synergistota bacterium]|nr:HIT domain-containing protein [Synergistota bacterium]